MEQQTRGPSYRIEDIKEQKIVTYCNSKEEWDKVCKIIPNCRLDANHYTIYRDKTPAIHIDKYGGSYGYKEWYETNTDLDDKPFIVIPASLFIAHNTPEDYQYKVDDRVERLSGDGKGFSHYIPAGMKGTVTHPIVRHSKYKLVQVKWDNGDNYNCIVDNLRLVSEATQGQQDEWKVGDVLPEKWLKLQRYGLESLTSNTQSLSIVQGDRTVTKVEKGWALISNTYNCWLPPKSQCIGYPGIQQSEPEWKVGDRARRIACPGGVISVGDEGKVLSIHSQGKILNIQWDNGKQTGCDTKYAEKIQHTEPTANIPVTVGNAVVDMRVVRTDEYCDRLLEPEKKGIEGTIVNIWPTGTPIVVQWDRHGGSSTTYHYENLWIAPTNTVTKQSTITNTKTNNYDKQEDRQEVTQSTDGYKQQPGDSNYQGTTLDLSADTEAIRRGKVRTGTALYCSGQSQQSTGRYTSNYKGSGYCEEA